MNVSVFFRSVSHAMHPDILVYNDRFNLQTTSGNHFAENQRSLIKQDIIIKHQIRITRCIS